jgi:hypothetical protein
MPYSSMQLPCNFADAEARRAGATDDFASASEQTKSSEGELVDRESFKIDASTIDASTTDSGSVLLHPHVPSEGIIVSTRDSRPPLGMKSVAYTYRVYYGKQTRVSGVIPARIASFVTRILAFHLHGDRL